jgi:serine acetyltransferase
MASVVEAWRTDLRRNRGSLKGALIVSLYRAGRALPQPLRTLYKVPYFIVTDCLLGITLPLTLDIGPGLTVQHGQGLVVSPKARIGSRVNLHQGVTIGERRQVAPVLEDDVSVGANAVVIGGITIGAGSVIGAGAIVVHDVPPGSRVVGQPAVAVPKS